ncbi:MAG: hypothetical protein GX303_02355 [Clostridiales bacterium]|nr:hypothetical protein [Clostridiales bacterium]
MAIFFPLLPIFEEGAVVARGFFSVRKTADVINGSHIVSVFLLGFSVGRGAPFFGGSVINRKRGNRDGENR